VKASSITSPLANAADDATAIRRMARLTIDLLERVSTCPAPEVQEHVSEFLKTLSADPEGTAGVLVRVLAGTPPGAGEVHPAAGPGQSEGYQVEPVRGRQSLRTTRLQHFIDEHFDERLTLPKLAAAVGTTRSHAATTFRNETGVTLHRYLARVRIMNAAELIHKGEKVEAAMLLVGYRSKKNFYRQFKAALGVTPAEYRHCDRGHLPTTSTP
jgi:AraC-like DNA-binding protein